MTPVATHPVVPPGRPPRRPARGAGIPVLVSAALLLAACGGDTEPDAWGNLEADEVTVSAETGGRLVRLDAREGERLAAGVVAAVVDSTTAVLQRRELVAQRAAARARASEVDARVGVLRVQLETAREELARLLRLLAADAATDREVNLQRGEVRRLEEQIEATRAQRAAAEEEAGQAEARLAQVERRLRESVVRNPRAGTVLTRFAEEGEFVQPGQPLYELADLSTLTLRAYVDGGRIADVRLGDEVEVAFDRGGDDRETRPGTVTWISDEAEFTPTPIQTREERVELVYAVEIRVDNADGALKIGMPAEVRGLTRGGSAPAGDR